MRDEKGREFANRIRYEEVNNYSRNNGQRDIHKPKTQNIKRKSKKGTQKRMRVLARRMTLLALTGVLAFGVHGAIAGNDNKVDTMQEAIVYNMPEEHGIDDVEFITQFENEFGFNENNLCQESLELYNELSGKDFDELTNTEIAQYMEQVNDMTLDVLKDKVGNVIGKKSYEFTLQTSSNKDGRREPTRVVEAGGYQTIEMIDSDEIDSIMGQIVSARQWIANMENGNVKRNKEINHLETVLEYFEKAMTIKLHEKESRKYSDGKCIGAYWEQAPEKNQEMAQNIDDEGR